MSEAIRVGLRAFRSHLASYVEKVGQGQVVVVTQHGREVGRFVPPEPAKGMPWGCLIGKGWLGPDFDDPLPEEIIDAVENGPIWPE